MILRPLRDIVPLKTRNLLTETSATTHISELNEIEILKWFQVGESLWYCPMHRNRLIPRFINAYIQVEARGFDSQLCIMNCAPDEQRLPGEFRQCYAAPTPAFNLQDAQLWCEVVGTTICQQLEIAPPKRQTC